ncbi:hypothetical protein niasHS_016981 [Heterodera schachtii]|uniref:Uncharacterized protein n=1 Tax=Heterodera schachtii TaxID=97005 RepID=A0ABD2HVR0_HETSC
MTTPSIRLIATSKAPAATGYRWKQWTTIVKAQFFCFLQPGSARQQPDAVRERPDRDDIRKDGCGAGWSASRGEAGDDQLGEILTYAGSSFKHVINCNIMVTNMSDFQDVNETFKNFFTADTYPARSFFQVVKLPKNALVMIDAVAVVAGQ